MHGSSGGWAFIFICAIIGFLGSVIGGIWFIIEAIMHLHWS